MDGLELAARFSAAPNALGLCGPKGFQMSAKRQLAAQLKRFLAPYTYLSLIAGANGLEPFDTEVVEAFWLGNKLLDAVKREDMANAIMKKFTGPGRLKPERAQALAEALPARVYPHHSFHVFYIGSISGVLRGTAAEMDRCRVGWGEVKKVNGKQMQVGYRPIQKKTKKEKENKKSAPLAFGPEKNVSWKLWSDLPAPSSGSLACSHWGQAIIPISRRRMANLEKYTRLNMELYSRPPVRNFHG